LPVARETAVSARPTAREVAEPARAIAQELGATALVALAVRRHGRFAAELAVRELGATLGAPAGNGTRTLYAAFAEREAWWAVATPATSGLVLPVASGLAPPAAGGATRPSRAGAKADEALAVLAALGITLPGTAEVLELGAFPGGITTALAARGWHVEAVDLVPIPAVAAWPNVHAVVADVRDYVPRRERYDGLFCDVNGDPLATAGTIARLAPRLAPGAPVVLTIKLPRWSEAVATRDAVVASLARAASLRCVALRHLGANRQELTYFGQTAR
jgi:hypothetical protein